MASGHSHAGLWSGSPLSFVDLHPFLSPDFSDSIAQAIWSDASNIYVVGYGNNQTTVRHEAMLWTRHLCPADITPVGSPNGVVDVNDLLAVITTWGACAKCPPAHCAADIAPVGSPQGDCQIDVNDLLYVITHWGACP